MTPKDLGIKIGTKEEVFWTDFKKTCEENILGRKRDILIQKEIIKLCDSIIKEEQQK